MMLGATIATSALLAAALSLPLLLSVHLQAEETNGDFRLQLFEAYLKLHNRSWPAEEMPRRLENFWRNHELIERFNRDYAAGKRKYSMRENNWMDLEHEELERLHGLMEISAEELEEEFARNEAENRDLPAGYGSQADGASREGDSLAPEVDWRESGCVKEIFDQEDCGSCYATAAVDVLQTMRCLKLGSSPQLSYQQILDCPSKSILRYRMINGCNGGRPERVYDYLNRLGYVATTDCYPITNSEDRCQVREMPSECMVRASPSDGPRLRYRMLRSYEQMLEAVANRGPIVAFFEASDSLNWVSGEGIYQGEECKSRVPNHAVVLVGYGQEQGQQYWLMRNSWGTSFGQDGYIKVKRGENTCLIESTAVVVIE